MGESDAGGVWGAELNAAGFDAIVIQGFAPADDRLPPRMSEPLGDEGPGAPIEPGAIEATLSLYYGMMGWDPSTGVPRPAKLYELDIGWFVPVLANASGAGLA